MNETEVNYANIAKGLLLVKTRVKIETPGEYFRERKGYVFANVGRVTLIVEQILIIKYYITLYG